MAEKKKNDKDKQKQLVKLIHNDTKLTREEKMEYSAMADIYLENLKDNLNKTSIELNEVHPEIEIDVWREFLTVPVIRKYLQGFKDEQIATKADEGLMKGDKDAVGIKKVMAAQGPVVNNSNIVLIRLPEKVDFSNQTTELEFEVEGV